MNTIRIPSLRMVSGLACWLVVAAAEPAQAQTPAQTCAPIHSAGFARLRTAEGQANTQGSADLAVRALFGARIDLCEEGAYKTFMLSFKDFASAAMRAQSISRDRQLRLAIATIGHAPIRVSAKESKEATSTFRNVRSELSALANEIGFKWNPLFAQLLETLGRIGAPTADQ